MDIQDSFNVDSCNKEMKVSIITILDNTNFGTYLQALATGKIIESLGYEAEIVRYTRPSMTGWGQLKYLFLDRGILSVIRNAWKIPRTLKLRDRDFAFLSKFQFVTNEYVGFESLQKNPPMADVYLVGSDQVWNSFYNKGIDKSFYLDFAPMGKKRVSYASSIGMDSIPDKEESESVALLKKFSGLTVREQAGKELLAQYGIQAEVVLDPTLLLDAKEWSSIANKYPMHPSEKYLLVYSVEHKKQDLLIDYYARMIAKQRNLKIYQVSYSGTAKKLSCADKFYGQATPDVFLNLMKKASFVVVSSFHGTAFSVNFGKEFLTISANRFNSRVVNLLNITDLNGRLVSDRDFDVSNLREIDYSVVDARICKARRASIEAMYKLLKQESKS